MDIPKPHNGKWYTPKEVMDITNTGRALLYKHLSKGILKGERVKGSWQISEDSIIDYLRRKALDKAMREPIAEKDLPPPGNGSYYSMREIASFRHRDLKVIWNDVHAGILKAFKAGNAYMVTPEDLKEYLNKFREIDPEKDTRQPATHVSDFDKRAVALRAKDVVRAIELLVKGGDFRIAGEIRLYDAQTNIHCNKKW